MTDTDQTASNQSTGEVEANPTPITEGQPATDAAKPETDGTTEGEDKGQPQGAPEAYEAFALPENYKLEGERLTTATEFFKANNFTQAQAQQAIDLFTKITGEDIGAVTQALEAQRVQRIETWGQQTKEALGTKYDETINLARTAVKHVGDEELTAAFESEGWGNHPALIRAFAKFGELARDSSVEGLGGVTATGAPKTLAERMYPSQT